MSRASSRSLGWCGEQSLELLLVIVVEVLQVFDLVVVGFLQALLLFLGLADGVFDLLLGLFDFGLKLIASVFQLFD